MKTETESGSDQITDYDDDGVVNYENSLGPEYYEEETAMNEASDESY